MKFTNLILLFITLTAAVICFSCKNSSGDKEMGTRQTTVIDPKREVTLDGNSGKRFDILTGKSTGIHFMNDLRDNFQINDFRFLYEFQGSGVNIGDINGDGLQDLYFIGNVSPNKLYLNKGNLQFEDITAKSGINKLPGEWTMSSTMVDIDGDGDLDIYECLGNSPDSTKRKNRLFINNGNLTFTDKSAGSGLENNTYSTMANFFDYDNDGDLDMYLTTHPTDFTERNTQKAFQKIEQHKNASNRFYVNNGDGTFTEKHAAVGIDNHGYSLSVTVGDLNNDGFQDVYVANDFAMYDFVYMNDGHGKFIDESLKVLKKTSINAMGSDIADFNNDGFPDIMVTDMDMEENYSYKTFQQTSPVERLKVLVNAGYGYQNRSNSLQLNNGDGTFSEISRTAGVATTDWSWGNCFADFDNDGYKDLFVSNGYPRDFNMDEDANYFKLKRAVRINDSNLYYNLRKDIKAYTLDHPNFIFRNNGDLTFKDERDDWGIYYPSISYGGIYADLDNDGDLDIVCSNANTESFIYRNNSEKLKDGNNWLAFKYKGYAKNTGGLGTKVTIYYDSTKLQTIQHTNVRGYLSSTENDTHFGLGKTAKVDMVEVSWLDGSKQILRNVAANQVILLDHANASKAVKFDEHYKPQPYFARTNDNLGIDFKHTENDYDDYLREFTLPHKMSTLGPGMAVADVNGDGLDDIFIGGAQDQSGAIYTQKKEGGFVRSSYVKDNMQCEDAGALFFDADGDGDNDLVIATGGNEHKAGDTAYAVRLYLNDGKGNFTHQRDAVPGNYFSGSGITGADYDKDGDMDLFIAGRQVPGKYLESTSSYIYRNDHGKFTDVSNEIAPALKNIGMVTSAVWSDFNNDGSLDLVIAGDWMPVMFLKNSNGKFTDVTAQTGLTNNTGWWQSLTAADLDNDGDMDYICGNFGTNRRFKNTVSEKDGHALPFEAYLYDFDKSGTQDLILGYYQHDVLYPVKSRERLIEQIPNIAKQYPTWDAYGKASLQDIFGSDLDKAIHKTAYVFKSVVLINDGTGKFTEKALPVEAQVSPIFGAVVDDFNEDGILDILTHGNFYNTDIEITRHDASTGLLLIGKGNGEFTPVPSYLSGFWSDGDTKSLVVLLDKSKAPVYVCAASNMPVKAFKLDKYNHDMMELQPKDAYAMVTMTDGKTRKMEFCAGSGYMSECSKYLRLTPQMKQVEVFDVKGTQRTVFPNVIAKK